MGLEGVHPIIQQLASHVTNKNDKKAKESVMLAYECLARRFQRLFEPYIVEVMPNIVFEGWSDSSKDVRQAATDAAQVILKQMTGHAVRMILPNVLSSIRDTGAQSNWRQKQANIRLLGHMAYCAPRQLSSSLQVIVQALSESLNDTHPDVTSAAQKALERIGGAVANPEIAQQVPTLIKALHDPEKFTNEVLEALLYTRFTHSIDAASLALLAPILFRGLRERATHIKRKSAQIIGSMSSLVTNPSDMMPYVPPMVPLLQQILLDPNPQVRASAAKAFGSLSKSIGEDRMGDLIPWLHKRLKTSSSGDTSTVISVERSGAAQALCEIIAAQGVARLEESLPFLLAQISRDNEDFEEEEEEDDEIKGKRDRQSIREGYLQLFIYLPSLMKHDFERFLPLTLPKVLDGLSDNSEIVRETALASCKVIVELFATSTASFEMLLPALRDGLENEEWRVRYYSVMLMSDFLERISQKNTPVSQTSEFDTKINIETLQKVLGESMVDQILSLLFLCMNDSHPYVKSEATLLWRGMVPHTPRTLRAIVSTSLVGLIIQHLNKNEEQRINAARALGELVAKLGDKVLGDVIPQLADQLKSDDVETRIGVCHGLRELMNSASEKHLKQHTKKLLPAVKRAVCDRDESVQEAASLAFDVLYRVIGSKAVSDIITQLMTDLGGDDREVALSGLKQLVRVRPQSVLPKLVPAMLESPITATQAKALTAVCQSLGAGQQQHLSEHLPNIVSSLTNEISTFPEELPTAGPIITDERAPNTGFMFAALSAAMENIEQDDFEDIIELFRMNLTSNIVVIRRSYALTMQVLFQALAKRQTAVDGGSDLLGDEEFLQEEYPLLLEHTLRLYNDPDENVIRAAIGAVTAIITSLKKEVWPNYIDNVRDVIRSLSEDDSGTKVVDRLPGFVEEKGKGMDALLQLFLQGLVYGKSPEVREQAALGLGDMIELTDAKALSPHVLKVTGPLIRIVGDRFPWQVKAAILKTLSLLLDKGGVSLKPFLPQLQTILIKSLQDANVVVRKYAQEALAKLVPLGARPDNLVGELNTGIKTQAFTKQSVTQIELGSNNTTGIVISLLMALNGVMKNEDVGKKLKSTVLDTAVQQLLLFLMITENAGEEESLLAKLKDIGDLIDAASACLATLLRYVPAEQFQTTLGQLLQPSVGVSLQSKLILLSLLLTGRDISRDEAKQARELIRASLKDFASVKADVVPIVTQGLRASANLLWHIIEKGQGDASDLVNEFSTLHATANAQNQLRYELAKVMKYVAKQCHKMGNTEELYPWVKPLASIGVKDRYIPVKLCSERILMYILSGNALKEYMNRWREFVGDEKEAKTIVEFASRVLSRLGTEDSDNEQQ
jgi:HEAT repeat protein